MKYKILLSLLVVSVLGCGVADAQYSRQEKKPTIADDFQEHYDYWKPVTDWIFSWKGAVLLGLITFVALLAINPVLVEGRGEYKQQQKSQGSSDDTPSDEISF